MHDRFLIALAVLLAGLAVGVMGVYAFTFVYLFATQPAMWVILGGLLVLGPLCDWILGGSGRL